MSSWKIQYFFLSIFWKTVQFKPKTRHHGNQSNFLFAFSAIRIIFTLSKHIYYETQCLIFINKNYNVDTSLIILKVTIFKFIQYYNEMSYKSGKKPETFQLQRYKGSVKTLTAQTFSKSFLMLQPVPCSTLQLLIQMNCFRIWVYQLLAFC